MEKEKTIERRKDDIHHSTGRPDLWLHSRDGCDDSMGMGKVQEGASEI